MVVEALIVDEKLLLTSAEVIRGTGMEVLVGNVSVCLSSYTHTQRKGPDLETH